MPAQRISGDFEMIAARPNKTAREGHGRAPSAGSNPGYDGKVGWSHRSHAGPAVLTGKELSETADDAFFDGPLYGSDLVKKRRPSGSNRSAAVLRRSTVVDNQAGTK